MTYDDITKLINKRGDTTKTVFYSTYTKILYIEFQEKSFNDATALSIFCYNVTILILNLILEYPDFFEDYNINKRRRNQIVRDLKHMKRIEYPEYYGPSFSEEYEIYIVEDLRIKTIGE
jgi:hypothetical protein